MTSVIPFEADRFRSTAARYHARPAYAPRLIRRVAEACRLTPASSVLDLGCGPGPLAIAFARLAGRVLAVDPEPEMLAEAARGAASAGVAIEFREGSSNDLGPDLGRFDLVTIGRAFHWMDRADTLRRLDAMLGPDGAIALFDDSHPELPDNRWLEPYRAISDRYAERGAWRNPGWIRHEAVLLDSPFAVLERFAAIERRSVPAETLVDRVLSRSTSSPARIGAAAAAALATELREFVTGIATDGRVTEVVETSALVARR